MKILVTGSSGFVGSAFVKYAREKGHKVFEFDLPTKNILKNVEPSIQKSDIVVHMAAIADLYETAKDIDKNFDVNIKGTWNVAKACERYDKPLINISTCCVYGDANTRTDNEDKTIPATIEPYACSKMAGEYLLRGFEHLFYANLRIGTVYGPGMRPALFNYVALEKVMKGQVIKINGNGKQTRTYIYIDDLVKGIYQACIRFDKIALQTINI